MHANMVGAGNASSNSLHIGYTAPAPKDVVPEFLDEEDTGPHLRIDSGASATRSPTQCWPLAPAFAVVNTVRHIVLAAAPCLCSSKHHTAIMQTPWFDCIYSVGRTAGTWTHAETATSQASNLGQLFC